MDRVDAERTSSLRIRGDVVDIDSALRINRKPLEQQFENAGVGLDDPDLTRDQNAAKPAQKLEALESLRVSLGRRNS